MLKNLDETKCLQSETNEEYMVKEERLREMVDD